MAYSGTTAATTLRNPPNLIARAIGRLTSTVAVLGATGLSGDVQGGTGIWHYASTDTVASAQGVGYFTDGLQLGMRVGDILISFGGTSLGATPTGFQIGVLVTTNSSAGFNTAVGLNIAAS